MSNKIKGKKIWHGTCPKTAGSLIKTFHSYKTAGDFLLSFDRFNDPQNCNKRVGVAKTRLTRVFVYISGKRRYNIKLWKTFTDCFNCLPVAAIVDEKIFCCHGGLSPDLQSMEQIRRIMRPTDVPDQGLLCDLLWSDPDKVKLPKIKRTGSVFLSKLLDSYMGNLDDYTAFYFWPQMDHCISY